LEDTKFTSRLKLDATHLDHANRSSPARDTFFNGVALSKKSKQWQLLQRKSGRFQPNYRIFAALCFFLSYFAPAASNIEYHVDIR